MDEISYKNYTKYGMRKHDIGRVLLLGPTPLAIGDTLAAAVAVYNRDCMPDMPLTVDDVREGGRAEAVKLTE